MNRKYHPALIAITAALALVVVGVVGFRLLPEGIRGRRLLNALNGGHTDLARLLILLGADANFQTGHGSAMHYAAATGDIDLMRFLWAHGAEVDSVGEAGITPLDLARLKGNEVAVRFLLARGAKPGKRKIVPP